MKFDIATTLRKYIHALNTQDLPALAKMYANDVSLVEWDENEFRGIDEVLSSNEEMFEKNPEIQFLTVNYAFNDYSAFVDLVIYLTEEDQKTGKSIRVVDEIFFDTAESPKIFLIRAYKGFS